MTVKFETGKTYYDRSACDWDSVSTLEVVRRTAKTIWTKDGKCLRVSEYAGVEKVKPNGSYSMCSVMSADRFLNAEGEPK